MAYRPKGYFEILKTLATPPADLGAGTTIVLNDAKVALSRKDPWIRAASTSTVANFVPGFVRVAGVITFDIILCNGAGRPVPNAQIDIITAGGPTAASAAAATTVAAATTSAPAANAGVLHQEPIVGVLVAQAAPLGNQTGRRMRFQANSSGRLTGTVTMFVDQNQFLLIDYLHHRTSVLVLAQPA